MTHPDFVKFHIQTCSAKESGSSPRCDPMAAQQHLWPASQASLRILMSGQGFLKDFKAFGSRPSLAEVHFPFHFVDFLDFGELHDSDDSGGRGDPIFGNFHQMDSVGSRSEINLLVNRVRKMEKRIQCWTLWQDLLQYDVICVVFSEFRHSGGKVEGGYSCGKKSENPQETINGFGLGTGL